MYAGFWRRVAAVLIDTLILGAVTAPFTFGFDWTDGYSAGRSGASSIPTVVSWLYYALMESSAKQATLGKMALGIRVTDLDGNRVGFGKATGRYFGKIVSALTLGIGFLMAAFTQRKQALHDIMAGTLVVRGQIPATTGAVPPPLLRRRPATRAHLRPPPRCNRPRIDRERSLSPPRHHEPIATLGAGEFFGEMAIMGGEGRRVADVVATSRSDLRRRALSRHPSVRSLRM